MSKALSDKWAEANENPGKKVSIGDIVVCDICDKDYTSSDKTGGFIFVSKAYCPDCASKSEGAIKKYGEEKYIRARCPAGTPFADFVRQYRGDFNYVSIHR